MKIIKRDSYLNKLIDKRNNGLAKIITGIRRCGKSFLLDPIFIDYLKTEGVEESHIIKIELDNPKYEKFYNNSEGLYDFIKLQIKDNDNYYLLLDEIQLVNHFETLINGLLHLKNVDIYVTGSNSRFLSTDIITEFRGRGDQVNLFPLKFNEFLTTYDGEFSDAMEEYKTYGGMPLVLTQRTDTNKAKYLKNLYNETYYRDIVDRYNIQRLDILDTLIQMLASSMGSLTNPQRLYNTFKSNGETELSLNTLNKYISYLEDSFLIKKANRYNIKGKKYINSPYKYYFTDIGLRNACLNFRQMENNHLYENIVFNELVTRDYNVDVGVVPITENRIKKSTEVDFVCNQGYKRYYIQVALGIDTPEKKVQESKSLININDNFKKIIIVAKNIKPWMTDDGISVIGIKDFLLKENSLEM